jgi:hypothetical protein
MTPATPETSPRRSRGRLLFLLYALVALALALVLLSSFTFLRSPHHSSVIPTAAPLPTFTPRASPTPGPTATPMQPGATPSPCPDRCAGNPAAIAISPSEGSIGTFVTLIGAHLNAGHVVTVGYSATANCAAGATPIPGVVRTVNGDGTVEMTFTWPQTQQGSFTICVADTQTGERYPSYAPFTVLSASSASITTASSVAHGKAITVSGRGFASSQDGGLVEVLYGPSGSPGCATSVATATVGSDGSFTVMFAAPEVTSDQVIVIAAVSPQGSCGSDRVVTEAQTATFVQAAASSRGSQDTSTADNPLNLPTPVLQALFVFATVSGLASLARFIWDAMRGTVGGARRLTVGLQRRANSRR